FLGGVGRLLIQSREVTDRVLAFERQGLPGLLQLGLHRPHALGNGLGRIQVAGCVPHEGSGSLSPGVAAGAGCWSRISSRISSMKALSVSRIRAGLRFWLIMAMPCIRVFIRIRRCSVRRSSFTAMGLKT